MSSCLKKIYIAGFDVFKEDSIDIGKKYVELCKQYSFIGLYPLDNQINTQNKTKKDIAEEIFQANKKMIEQCDIVIANLNPFRGKEADSGTVWECGYAKALNKEVYVYMNDTKEYIEQFQDDEKHLSSNGYVDKHNMIIEDFGHPINLMIACSSTIIQGGFVDVLEHLKKDD